MPAPFDFPGHYWDEAKGKFFKIEATATAPAGAQWSRQEVDAHDRRQQLVNQEQQRNRRRRQRQQSNRKDEAVPHKARPLPKRARIVSLQNAAGPSSSSSSSLHVDVEATLRWGRGAFDDDDDIPDDAEEHELATVRLFDRYPLLAHEVGEEASVGINRMRGRSHAGTTAALYARDFEYKGAVPILDESRAIGFEARNPPWDLQLPASERRTQAVPFWGAIDMPILSETKITCMYVHGEEVNPGAGIVYTNYYEDNDHQGIKGQYIPVNEKDYVVEYLKSPRVRKHPLQYGRTRPEELLAWNPTSICFHEGSRVLIVGSSAETSDNSLHTPVLQFFTPEVSDETTLDDDVTWQFGRNDTRFWGRTDGQPPPKNIYTIYGQGPDSVNACVASPRGFDSLCLVGTGSGLSAIDMATAMSVLRRDTNTAESVWYRNGDNRHVHGRIDAATFLRNRQGLSNVEHFMHESSDDAFFMKRQRHLGSPKLFIDKRNRSRKFSIAAVDFVDKHPRLAVAGGRHPVPWLVDLRERSWHAFGSSSMLGDYAPSIRMEGHDQSEDNAIAHVRSAGRYQVVAVSPRNKMLMYDLRYFKRTNSSRDEDVVAGALFRFQNYHNTSRTHGLGFDVDVELGIAAAAEEHDFYTGLGGGVSLYSLATGERLEAPGLWPICHSAERLARIYTPTDNLLRVPTALTAPATTVPRLVDSRVLKASSLNDFSDRPYITVKGPKGLKNMRKDFCDVFRTKPMPRVPALSFAALPHENTSLFVGVGSRVHKFSLSWGSAEGLYSEDERDSDED